MSGICVFLNTTILNDDRTVAKIGDTLLMPVRYLFNGANVAVTGNKDRRAIHHVASFHERGVEHICKTNPSFTSAPKGMMRTLVAVVCLIPGLILGSLIKGLSYASSPVTQKIHALAKKHFTPVSFKIGDERTGIQTEAQLKEFCEEIRRLNKFNQPIRMIHICANNDLVVNEDPGLFALNPMKIILEGGKCPLNDPVDTLKRKLFVSGKWRGCVFSNADEAAKYSAPRRNWSCKRYHILSEVWVVSKHS